MNPRDLALNSNFDSGSGKFCSDPNSDQSLNFYKPKLLMVLFQTDTQSVTHIQMAAIIFDRTIKADEKWAKLQKLSGAEDDTPETVK